MARRLIVCLIAVSMLVCGRSLVFGQPPPDAPPADSSELMPPDMPPADSSELMPPDMPPMPPDAGDQPSSPSGQQPRPRPRPNTGPGQYPTQPPKSRPVDRPDIVAPLGPVDNNFQTENVQPKQSSARDWPMFKGDTAHTGYTEEQLTYPLKLAWKFPTEIIPNNPSSPAESDSVIYMCAGRRLYAINAETGSPKWVYPEEESLTAVIKSSPLVGEDLVYFGGGDGKLYAITKDKGTLAWNFTTKGIMNSSPVLMDGVIYVGSSDDHLYALDAKTGEPRWPGGFQVRDDVSTSPAVVGGLVYFLSSDMILYAAHTSGGRGPKWAVRVGSWSRSATPIVSENTVYLAAGNTMQAYQAKSGRLKWGVKFQTDITTVPAADPTGIYFACKNGKLYALNTAGKVKWPAPADLGASAYGSPIVAGNEVIIGTNKGFLYAFDKATGELKWKYVVQPQSFDYGKLRYVNITSSPMVVNGTLYVVADDGTLHAFRQDAPDFTGPIVSTVVPPRDYLMPGEPPVQIAVVANDLGSGIKEDSITISLDGQPVEYKVIPERGIIWYKTEITQPIQPLRDGQHTVSLALSDWAGNKTSLSWSFSVDNRIPKVKLTTTQPTGAGVGNAGP